MAAAQPGGMLSPYPQPMQQGAPPPSAWRPGQMNAYQVTHTYFAGSVSQGPSRPPSVYSRDVTGWNSQEASVTEWRAGVQQSGAGPPFGQQANAGLLLPTIHDAEETMTATSVSGDWRALLTRPPES